MGLHFTSILDPESDWVCQMLVKDLQLDYEKDGRRVNESKSDQAVDL